DKIYVSSNGWMSFTYTHPSEDFGQIPDIEDYNIDMIALFWMDLNANDTNNGGGSVYYLFGGISPNRYLAIEYYNIYYGEFSETPSVLAGSFELILFENGSIY
ncbi:unnamed protein product, partial [marine sediment metagenome]